MLYEDIDLRDPLPPTPGDDLLYEEIKDAILDQLADDDNQVYDLDAIARAARRGVHAFLRGCKTEQLAELLTIRARARRQKQEGS